VNRAMWPNTDKRRLLMKSKTGGKPARADISALVTCRNHVRAEFGVGTSCEMPLTFFPSQFVFFEHSTATIHA